MLLNNIKPPANSTCYYEQKKILPKIKQVADDIIEEAKKTNPFITNLRLLYRLMACLES